MTLLSVSPLQGGSFYTMMGSSPLSPFVLSTSDTLYLGGIPNTLVRARRRKTWVAMVSSCMYTLGLFCLIPPFCIACIILPLAMVFRFHSSDYSFFFVKIAGGV